MSHVLTFSFSSLTVVSLSSLNTFKVTDIKSLSSKSNVWASLGTVFINYFPPICGPYFLVSLHVSYIFALDWVFSMRPLWSSDSPSPSGLVAIADCFVTFLC